MTKCHTLSWDVITYPCIWYKLFDTYQYVWEWLMVSLYAVPHMFGMAVSTLSIVTHQLYIDLCLSVCIKIVNISRLCIPPHHNLSSVGKYSMLLHDGIHYQLWPYFHMTCTNIMITHTIIYWSQAILWLYINHMLHLYLRPNISIVLSLDRHVNYLVIIGAVDYCEFDSCWYDLWPYTCCLSDWDQVMHICISKLGHLWFRQWLVAWSVPSHYLN